jgi:hypothetical protein
MIMIELTRDHDRLYAASIQTELDAAVVEEVELQVAAAPQQLPVPLLRRILQSAPPLCQIV